MAINTPSAQWTPQALVGELARAGWGDLAGADVRAATSVLTQLADHANFRTGEARVTLWQIAERAQYSTRWVSDRIGLLVDAGVLEYEPGYIADGEPRPSRFRLVKKQLAKLVIRARELREEALPDRYQEVRDRITAARLRWSRRRRPIVENPPISLRNSVHPSPPLRGTPRAIPPAEPPPPPPEPDRERNARGIAAVWAALRGQTT